MIEDFTTTPEQDAVFIAEYLKREGAEDAAVVACETARIIHPQYPVHFLAQYQLDRPEIQAAIRITKAGVVKQTDPPPVTRDTISSQMENVFTDCMKDKRYSEAIRAKDLQARVMRLLDPKIEVTHRLGVEDMSDAQLMQIASRSSRNLTIAGEYTDITPNESSGPAKRRAGLGAVDDSHPGSGGGGTSQAPQG